MHVHVLHTVMASVAFIAHLLKQHETSMPSNVTIVHEYECEGEKDARSKTPKEGISQTIEELSAWVSSPQLHSCNTAYVLKSVIER